MYPTDLENWPIFRLLDRNFLRNIHMAVVYGSSGSEALIVTKDGRVFGLGSNDSGCLGIASFDSTTCPEEVQTLSANDIKTFAFGSGPHVLALTTEGKIYSWGHNEFCQLGNEDIEVAVSFPVLINTKIQKECIVDIACGSHHSLALTAAGEVYAWGENASGQAGGKDSIQRVPQKISGQLAGKKIVCISCGSSFSIVVTDNGEVYGWGSNQFQQLGIGKNCGITYVPCHVTKLIGVVIEKVVCGYSHTLALAANREVYAWGTNTYGQLGLGHQSRTSIPEIVGALATKGILDIAASHSDHISVAMAEGNEIFIWGQCLGLIINVPWCINLKYMHHAFARYTTTTATYKPIILYNDGNSTSLIDSLNEAFDDQAESDLVIKVEEKPIYVHKAVLKIRSQYYRRMLSRDSETEGDESVIRQHQFSYGVYKAFLNYLYTDEIDLPMENMLELWALANLYSENELLDRCINRISKGITVQNVATIYSAAVQHAVADLHTDCLVFAFQHMSAVVHTESFSKLDPDIMKAFIVEVSKCGGFVH